MVVMSRGAKCVWVVNVDVKWGWIVSWGGRCVGYMRFG